MTGKYISTKFYKDLGPCAYRQWRDDGNCRLLHGYSFSFYFEFTCDELDARNWCVDFGGLRGLKDTLEGNFDHTVLCASDDPHIDWYREGSKRGVLKLIELEKIGSEALADMLYEYVNLHFLPENGWGERVWCSKVQVFEAEKNTAMRVGFRDI